jgi:hypothetical protein
MNDNKSTDLVAVRDPPDVHVREEAHAAATRLCAIAFKDRKGHGDGPCSYRQMRPAELTALLIVAFEAGVKWESRQ